MLFEDFLLILPPHPSQLGPLRCSHANFLPVEARCEMAGPTATAAEAEETTTAAVGQKERAAFAISREDISRGRSERADFGSKKRKRLISFYLLNDE